MFYCNKCALECGWPRTWFRSVGQCEICGKVEDCNDTPSKELPKWDPPDEWREKFDQP